MQISLNWIQRYISLKSSPEEIAKALTQLGFEVEGMEKKGYGLDQVVVGEVLACSPHPNADRLRVCRVYDGQEELPVVCGAPNVATGQRVVFARVGAQLPGGKIKKGKIRGEVSLGMICAQDELGLGSRHDGILVLPENAPVGSSLEEVEGLCDVILEVNVTPNRPDALCHIGLARELAAFYQLELQLPATPIVTSEVEAANFASVVVEDEAACSLYTGRVIRNLKVGPSPDWLVKHLDSMGQKSVNNVVDITNFVLLEAGHPSHAFDLDKIPQGKVVIRRANGTEALTTLDGVERETTAADLVIADETKPICLAGVMGGLGTEVTETTQNIFLEVAYFNPTVVRQQSKRHTLSSDSSYRFERGVDPLGVHSVSDTITSLIQQIAGGEVCRGTLLAQSPQHPQESKQVSLRPARLQSVLGIEVKSATVISMLQSIGFTKVSESSESLAFQVPGFRPDVEREIDLIEEVARLYDYNKIPATFPRFALTRSPLPPIETLSRDLREHLSARGLNETVRLRFFRADDPDSLLLPPSDDRRKAVNLKNPINEEWAQMQTTLIPGLLKAVAFNQKNQQKTCRLFEISKVFYYTPEHKTDRSPGVREEERLTLVLWGEWSDSAIQPNPDSIDYFITKGFVEGLLQWIPYDLTLDYQEPEPFLHPVESGRIEQAGAILGSFGMVHPRVTKAFEIRGAVGIVDLSLTELLKQSPLQESFSAFRTAGAVTREMNILVDRSLRHEDLVKRFPIHNRKHLTDVRLRSVYEGQGVPEGKKTMLYSFVYQAENKTLTDEEVNRIQAKLAQEIAKDPQIEFK